MDSDETDGTLVDDLQTELKNARLKGAGDLAATVRNAADDPTDGDRSASADICCCRALRSADGAGKIQIGVVEDVVELRAELNLQALDRSRELLVEREVSLVERRCAARVAAGIAEGLSTLPAASLIGGRTNALKLM